MNKYDPIKLDSTLDEVMRDFKGPLLTEEELLEVGGAAAWFAMDLTRGQAERWAEIKHRRVPVPSDL